MTAIRMTISAFALLFLAACAAEPPTAGSVAPEQLASFSVAADAANIDISPIGSFTSGREAPTELVQQALDLRKERLERLGDAPAAIPMIKITSVYLITTGQTVFLGGESIMRGDVWLVDASTGNQIAPPVTIEAGAGGFVLGGVLGAVTRDTDQEEITAMAGEFMNRARIALYGPEG